MRFSVDVVTDRLSPAAAVCENLQLVYVSSGEALATAPAQGSGK